MSDPHPEIGGLTTKCTCHTYASLTMPVPADPPEHDGLTATDAAPLIKKEIG
jgi:hypothetical protein